MNAARASLLALLVCWACSALALVAVPPLSGRVVDQTGTLSAGDVASLTQTLKDLETRKGSQIAVLIVPTTDGEAIEQYSLRVAEAWKIGRKKIDDGALLVIAKNDRRLRIEVGYGLEGALTDVTTKRIIDEDITPKFKTGDFAGGVSAGRRPDGPGRQWRETAGAGAAALAGHRFLNGIDPFNPFSSSSRSLSAARCGARSDVWSARPRPAASSESWPGSSSAAWRVRCGRRRARLPHFRVYRSDALRRQPWHAGRLVGGSSSDWRQQQQLEQFERRLQWRRRQLWRRRRIGELVA